MKCPTCGETIASRNQFCGNCGNPLSQQPTRAKSEDLLPSPSPHKHFFLVAGILAGVIVIFALLLAVLPSRERKKPIQKPTNLGGELTPRQPSTTSVEEIGPNAVFGEVISLQRGQITVRSLTTGKIYTVYVGHRTYYTQRRYPVAGEKIKVLYVSDRGYMKATQVEIQS
jgi:Na+/melibiose symporter-like transporter